MIKTWRKKTNKKRGKSAKRKMSTVQKIFRESRIHNRLGDAWLYYGRFGHEKADKNGHRFIGKLFINCVTIDFEFADPYYMAKSSQIMRWFCYEKNKTLQSKRKLPQLGS